MDGLGWLEIPSRTVDLSSVPASPPRPSAPIEPLRKPPTPPTAHSSSLRVLESEAREFAGATLRLGSVLLRLRPSYTAAGHARSAESRVVDFAHRSPMAGAAGEVSSVSNLPSVLSAMGAQRTTEEVSAESADPICDPAPHVVYQPSPHVRIQATSPPQENHQVQSPTSVF
jgi:hypothetical protein